MIQGFTETNIATDICTEDNRINTSLASTQIRFLVKFTNDLDGSVSYCYPTINTAILPRYTPLVFTYIQFPDMYDGELNLLPSGHWKYEIYEVSWIGAIVIEKGTAPATEVDVLEVADTNGVVEGIVTKGILNLTEKSKTEQVQYTEYQTTSGDNYVWYGKDIDIWNPIKETSLTAWWKNKKKITIISGDVWVWGDSSNNAYLLVQDTITERPAYNALTGALTFDPATLDNLPLIIVGWNLISISGEFSIGFKVKPNTYDGVILGDNTTANEFLQFFSSNQMRIKIEGLAKNFNLDSGTFGDDYILITRNSSDLVQMYHNGVLQADDDTMTGSFDINTVGLRLTDNDPYDGIIYEIQIYNSEGAVMSSNINNYLAAI